MPVKVGMAPALAEGREGEPAGQLLSAASVPLSVRSSCDTAAPQPVTVGLPFANGVLHTAESVCLRDAQDRPAPVQATALAHWPDGSVKWLLVDAVLGPLRTGCTRWLLRQTPKAQRPAGPAPLRVEQLP